MLIFWMLVIGGLLGYVFGHYIRPNLRLHEAIKEARKKGTAMLGAQNKGVYRTIITDQDQSSELVVEVRELAKTKSGQVKVEYLSAYYKNPVFRTKKGETLLREVWELLGEYLPQHEIEWYEVSETHENINKHLRSVDTLHRQHFG